jgi:hypothetical protein
MRGIYLLDVSEDEHPDDDSKAKISLHALSSACTTETMRLPVSVHDQALITLVDSSSTHCFMGAHVAYRLNLTPTAKDGMTVGVANGERLPCLRVCSTLPFIINGKQFCTEFLIIELEGYKMVLWCNWFCYLGPIFWDFLRLSMAFWWFDHRVKWIGLGAARSLAFALSTNNHLQLLLAESADIFAKPTCLPTLQAFDHRSHLLMCLIFHVVFLKKFTRTPPAAVSRLPPIKHGRGLPEPQKILHARLSVACGKFWSNGWAKLLRISQ